jgi:hypothetical protein
MSNVRPHMTIHLWHTRKLVAELAHGKLSERSSVQYMLVGTLLYAYNNYWALWFGTYRDWGFFLELFVVVAIGLLSVFECYKANGEDSGTEFMLRYCALAVPIGLKVAVLALLIGQVLYYGSSQLFGQGTFRDPALVYRLIYFVFTVSLAFVYYWRIAHHMARVRAAQESRAANAV